MKQLMILAAAVMLAVPVMADTFGSGANQFTLDFVTISANPGETRSTNTSGSYVTTVTNGTYGPWTDPGYNYRIGKFEITNEQWDKFVDAHGKPNGSPSSAYDRDAYWTGANVPTNNVSWYEAAQFVNWLNVEAGRTAAYKFTGTKGTINYTLGVWGEADAWGGTNLYRHKDAFYFLPTEDEWVKAAYWNGTDIQTYATKSGESLHQGDGIGGTGWNYYDDAYVNPYGPWVVGSGSEELNGTYDMMGNVWEWNERLIVSSDALRGGSFGDSDPYFKSSYRHNYVNAEIENILVGFRVASIPEPCTLLLLGIGGLVLRRKQQRQF